jgi:hypothetical protein
MKRRCSLVHDSIIMDPKLLALISNDIKFKSAEIVTRI